MYWNVRMHYQKITKKLKSFSFRRISFLFFFKNFIEFTIKFQIEFHWVQGFLWLSFFLEFSSLFSQSFVPADSFPFFRFFRFLLQLPAICVLYSFIFNFFIISKSIFPSAFFCCSHKNCLKWNLSLFLGPPSAPVSAHSSRMDLTNYGRPPTGSVIYLGKTNSSNSGSRLSLVSRSSSISSPHSSPKHRPRQ